MEKIKYGFQAHLSSKFPSQIIIDSTQFCNLSCIHCPHPAFKKSDAYSGAHLSMELHKKLIDEVATDGYGICQYIRYTANGETLVNPNIYEMIEYAGKYARTKINVTTNGVVLSENKAKRLLNAGVSVFDISIDAYTDETYAKVRVGGDLNRVRSNILRLIALNKEGGYNSRIVVSFVEQSLNSHETQLFEDFWNESGADYVVVRRLHSAAGSKVEIKHKMNNSSKHVSRKPCLYPWERLVVTPEGDLGFCPAAWTGESHFIKFSKVSIKEAWQSEFMKKLRGAHINNNFNGFDFCKQCPDWIYTKWPDESGKNYADMMHDVVPNDLL